MSESEEFGVLMKGEDVTNFTRIISDRDCYFSTPSALNLMINISGLPPVVINEFPSIPP